MYMDALESEVESLSAELTRLRIMLHRVTQVMEAPPPPPPQPPVAPPPATAATGGNVAGDLQQLLELLQNSQSLELLRSLLNVNNGNASTLSNATVNTSAAPEVASHTKVKKENNSLGRRATQRPSAKVHVARRDSHSFADEGEEEEEVEEGDDDSDRVPFRDYSDSTPSKGTEVSEIPFRQRSHTKMPVEIEQAKAQIEQKTEKRKSLTSHASDKKLSVVERLQKMERRKSSKEEDSSLMLSMASKGNHAFDPPLENLASFKAQDDVPSATEKDKSFSRSKAAEDYSIGQYSFSMFNDMSQGANTSVSHLPPKTVDDGQTVDSEATSSEDDDRDPSPNAAPILGARQVRRSTSPSSTPFKAPVMGQRTKVPRQSMLEKIQRQQESTDSEDDDDEDEDEEDSDSEEGEEEEEEEEETTEQSGQASSPPGSAGIIGDSPPQPSDYGEMVSQSYGNDAYSWGWQTPQMSNRASPVPATIHSPNGEHSVVVENEASRSDSVGYYNF